MSSRIKTSLIPLSTGIVFTLFHVTMCHISLEAQSVATVTQACILFLCKPLAQMSLSAYQWSKHSQNHQFSSNDIHGEEIWQQAIMILSAVIYSAIKGHSLPDSSSPVL